MTALKSHLKRNVGAMLLTVSLLTLPGAAWADGATLKVAVSGSATSLDPTISILNNYQLTMQIYEPLVARDADFNLIPGLALSWEAVTPTTWRFKLRPGVKFHDGADFTAEDAAFSITRAKHANSGFKVHAETLEKIDVIDPLTLEITTLEPDPIVPDRLTQVRILNKNWSVANKSEFPPAAGETEQSFTTVNANGTGPFMVKDFRPGGTAMLVKNPAWWGKGDAYGNVENYTYIAISNDATRLAALLSGEVDVVIDPPLQDIQRLRGDSNVRILEGPETRTMHIVLDSERDELPYSDVKGKNPFKDVRVRQALYQAIDVETLTSRIMRGGGVVAAAPIAPGVRGYSEAADKRQAPYDVEAAKKLLADAGYPDGFGFTYDCTNNRYQNDEAICQAIVAMWSRVNMKVTLNAQQHQTFFTKVRKRDSDAFMIGTGAPLMDGYYAIQINMLDKAAAPGNGLWSLGYTNPAITEIAAKAKNEFDLEKRGKLIEEAMAVYKSDFGGIPLYHNVGIWAVRGNVKAKYRTDGVLDARFVTVD